MIAKGLDFPDITLVGIINADLGLHMPDFRSSEKIFQLIYQASGRSGRGEKKGQVIIQTYDSENPVIKAAAKLDLNEYLIKQKEATFFVRIKGDSMIDAGIHDNDIVVVDKSQTASTGDIILASIDGVFTVKLLSRNKSKYQLLPANEKYKPIEINESMQFEVWGVVTGAVRKFK